MLQGSLTSIALSHCFEVTKKTLHLSPLHKWQDQQDEAAVMSLREVAEEGLLMSKEPHGKI